MHFNLNSWYEMQVFLTTIYDILTLTKNRRETEDIDFNPSVDILHVYLSGYIETVIKASANDFLKLSQLSLSLMATLVTAVGNGLLKACTAEVCLR